MYVLLVILHGSTDRCHLFGVIGGPVSAPVALRYWALGSFARLGRYTVARWERHLAASILCQSQQWYADQYAYLDTLQKRADGAIASGKSYPRQFSYALHLVRGDATNSRAGCSKAHSCEITSVFCTKNNDSAHSVWG